MSSSRTRSSPRGAIRSRRRSAPAAEPVFGHLATLQDGKRLPLRGSTPARGEWQLLAAGHNLRKIFTHEGSVARLAAVIR
jgi:hypothetical protein